jgi:hypothetical protein
LYKKTLRINPEGFMYKQVMGIELFGSRQILIKRRFIAVGTAE